MIFLLSLLFAKLPYSEIYKRASEQGVPTKPLERALRYHEMYSARFPNQQYISVLDFGLHSGKERWFLIHTQTGAVEKYLVSHGRGSDRDHNGYAENFSNVSKSHASSLGFYATAETYSGKHGFSLRLDGLSSTNSNARERAIVVHGADYVNSNRDKMGRSLGCPALDRKHNAQVITKIKEGSLLYIYSEGFNETGALVSN